jgi:transmembrane sensor
MTDETPELERWVLLARYAAGDCSPAERARVERWLAADPSRRLVLEELRMAAADAALIAEPANASAERAKDDVEWRKLATAIGARKPALGALTDATRRRRVDRVTVSVIGLAAALVVGIVVTRVGSRARGAVASGWRDYATAPGERETVTLADGTQFTLAPATRVRVPLAYGHGERHVSVEGEAYFSVVHDASQPFVVHAGNATATDVGTTFDVRAYGAGKPVVIAVAEGQVALTASGPESAATPSRSEPTALRAGDVALVESTGAIQARATDIEPYVGWTRGELVFADTPLRDVLETLGRWYGVRIVLADPALGGRPIRATYTTQSMTDVLALVTSAVGAHYTRDNGSGTISVVPDRPSR